MANRFNISGKTNLFGLKIPQRKFFAVLTLISGTLAWFILVQLYFLDIFAAYSTNTSLIYLGLLLFYGVGALSAFIGSSLSEKVSRRRLLFFWVVMGVVLTLSLGFFQGEILMLVLSLLLGVCFGLGFPSCMALFADYTVVEERAKVSGLIILVAFLLTFLGIIVVAMLRLQIVEALLLFAAFRIVSLIGVAIDGCERMSTKKISWFSVLSFKDFASYIVPWILFNAAAGLLAWWDIPKTPEFENVLSVGVPVAYISIAIFGLVAGVVADRFGRRGPIMISFSMLGISFGLLAFSLTPLTMLIYYIIYGIAWGFLFTLYLAVPGDLSSSRSREKFYSLGTMLPLIVYMGLSAAPQLFHISLSANALAPILSIVVFLSIIPVFRAAETLPEKFVSDRKLKEHMKKVEEMVGEERNRQSD